MLRLPSPVLDIIAQQLDWLPFRHAKNPAGYLIAAIEGNYSEPRAVREERIFRELRYGESQAGSQENDEDSNKEDLSDEDSSDEDSSHPVGEDVSESPSDEEPTSANGLTESQAIDLPLPREEPKR